MSIHDSDAKREPTVDTLAHKIFSQIVGDDTKLFPITDLYLDYKLNRVNLPE